MTVSDSISVTVFLSVLTFDIMLKCCSQAGSAVRGDLHLHRQPGQVHRDPGPGEAGGGGSDLHRHELLLVHPGSSPGPGGGHLAQVSPGYIKRFKTYLVDILSQS